MKKRGRKRRKEWRNGEEEEESGREKKGIRERREGDGFQIH